MAVETKRGCGYRQVGGLYMVAGDIFSACDRLPFKLTICSCCGAGIKFSRGFTWIEPTKLFEGDHSVNSPCPICLPAKTISNKICPVCFPNIIFGDLESNASADNDPRAGLIWIGATFYKTPSDFIAEGIEQGISRRIAAIPRGFELGNTWVFCAHINAVEPVLGEPRGRAGIFAAFKPILFERIVLASEYNLYIQVITQLTFGLELQTIKINGRLLNQKDIQTCKRMKADEDRGITFVPVPDDDPDHQSNLAHKKGG